MLRIRLRNTSFYKRVPKYSAFKMFKIKTLFYVFMWLIKVSSPPLPPTPRVYFKTKRTHCFVLRPKFSSILAHLVFPIIGPWQLALCSDQPQRIQKSQLSQQLMICDNPKWQFPINPRLPSLEGIHFSFTRWACSTPNDITACNQFLTHFPRLILWAE